MYSGYDDLAVLALAVALDLIFGEPPMWAHPTVWIGRHIGFLEKRAPREGFAGLAAGVIIALTLPIFWGVVMYLVAVGLKEIHTVVYILVGAALLKTTFSVRLLHREAELVRGHLDRGDMDQVRARMPSLVSRDPGSLTAEQATAATVESVSENINDSFLAPWLFFAIFGLPGAFAYRAVNTLDSMIGYRGVYERLGKASARLDDLLNLVPARLAGLLLVAASGFLPGQRIGGAWSAMWRHHGRTQSPNAGWTMSGMAGALGVQLEKVDPKAGYKLGDPDRPLEPQDIRRAVQSMYLVGFFGVIIALAVVYARGSIL
ncbi:MAG: adenosylcobinamide-phosphate synthase CbiB [Chloroflexi bacterium]|nr:adenosylcobinamide-phosphate synthase CbiB [Chloroflexota bacterium]MDA1270175.1 adenosylcobinamide-phosphate synthase CbiB [Chloroflexota bacterium]